MGRTFFRNDEVFRFNLRPQSGYKRPGMVNLQQYYLEEYLVRRAQELGVDQRRANFQRVRHAGPIGVAQKLVTHIERRFQRGDLGKGTGRSGLDRRSDVAQRIEAELGRPVAGIASPGQVVRC